jgi:hypothetical protein
MLEASLAAAAGRPRIPDLGRVVARAGAGYHAARS